MNTHLPSKQRAPPRAASPPVLQQMKPMPSQAALGPLCPAASPPWQTVTPRDYRLVKDTASLLPKLNQAQDDHSVLCPKRPGFPPPLLDEHICICGPQNPGTLGKGWEVLYGCCSSHQKEVAAWETWKVWWPWGDRGSAAAVKSFPHLAVIWRLKETQIYFCSILLYHLKLLYHSIDA